MDLVRVKTGYSIARENLTHFGKIEVFKPAFQPADLVHFRASECQVQLYYPVIWPVNEMKPDSTIFNIQPNARQQRGTWVWMLLGLIVISLGVALRLAWLGFWMVLPFTLLDLALVILVICLVNRNSNYIEKVRVGRDGVEIFHLEKNNNQSWLFNLHWIRVNLKSPIHRWYPHKLLLGASGKWVEIGQCLTEDERGGLADALDREITRVRNQDKYVNA